VGYGEAGIDGGPNRPLVMHDSNGTWSENFPKIGAADDDTELLGVDAVSATNIWATGFTVDDEDGVETIGAVMLHSTGGAFTEVELGGTTSGTTYSQLDSISAVSASDIWVVGYADDLDPVIEHYDGTSWTEVPSGLPDSVELEAVTAVSPTSAWAVGESYSGSVGQVMIHWDGKKWSRVVLPPTKDALVYGLDSSNSGYAVAVGNVNDAPFVEAFTPSVRSKPAAGSSSFTRRTP
jgi:hypothetical protein